MNARSLLVVVALSSMIATGCAGPEDGETDNCVSPLLLRDRMYVWTPAGNHYVAPGHEVGTATIQSTCSGQDTPDDAPARRTVYAFPKVSPDEAIVVTDGRGKHGTVYRAEIKPTGGWDPDFQQWLDRTGALRKQNG